LSHNLPPARRPLTAPTIERVTLIVAWRDPFWLVSDDLETADLNGMTSSSGPKIKRIPDSRLACGISGSGVPLTG
jgi:hypothetical protein